VLASSSAVDEWDPDSHSTEEEDNISEEHDLEEQPTDDDDETASEIDRDPDDNNGQDNQDPDEEVDMQEDQFIVESIKAHKRLSNGSYKYLVNWAGYDDTTWEGQGELDEQLRKEYHKAKKAQQADERAQALVKQAAIEQRMEAEGFNVRARRSRPSATTPAARQQMVKEVTDDLQDKGVSYYKAYEQAESEVAL
jgi:chromobox protein 1